ncbi:MAG TPA: hypothetical protein VGR74_04765, partial [Actinomycetota bacterium]|nr:hypothetical protein [Actinomycetota bacterium]
MLGGEFAGRFGQGPAAAAGLDLTPAVLACQQVCFEPVTVAPWELAAEVGGGGPLRVLAHGGLPAVRGPLGPAPCGRGAPRPAPSPGAAKDPGDFGGGEAAQVHQRDRHPLGRWQRPQRPLDL